MRNLFPCFLLLAVFTGGCFPKHPGPRLAHFDTTAPQMGEPAPPFTLRRLDGELVELAELIGKKPIVLQLGSHSCPVYRYRRHWMNTLIEDYGERVEFLLVYTVEAHPVGAASPYKEGEEWDVWINRLTGVRVAQADTDAERQRQAQASHDKLELGSTMLVDDLDNNVWQTYGAASSPAFVIDLDGNIALRQVWIGPKEIRQALDQVLAAGARDAVD